MDVFIYFFSFAIWFGLFFFLVSYCMCVSHCRGNVCNFLSPHFPACVELINFVFSLHYNYLIFSEFSKLCFLKCGQGALKASDHCEYVKACSS